MSALSNYFLETLGIVLLGSLIPLLVSSAVGLTVSFLQAITSIQEQTTTFLIKLVTISLILILFGGRISDEFIRFTGRMLGSLSMIGRG